jgi:peroxiredoxin Q/BCP
MSAPAQGDLAPDFDVLDTTGLRLHLAALVDRGPVVLAFFPRAFTPVCSRELAAYRDLSEDLAARAATVIAVSGDREARQADFRRELGADFSFVADRGGRLMASYGVKLPLIPMARRTTFVIGRGRRILRVDHGDAAATIDGAVTACARF